MSDVRIVIGAMSGTSADGVDAAVVRINGRGTSMAATLIAHRHHPYDPQLRQFVFQARAATDPVRLGDLARLGRQISLVYAQATRDAVRGRARQGAAPYRS